MEGLYQEMVMNEEADQTQAGKVSLLLHVEFNLSAIIIVITDVIDNYLH